MNSCEDKKLKKALLSAQNTKEKLCILALNSYLVDGAHNTNFQGLANQLGISQAAIYKHYKNKEDLLVAAIDYAASKGRLFIDEGEKLDESAVFQFKYYLVQNLNFCVFDRLHSVALITLHYFAVCVPEVTKLHLEINRLRINRIEKYIISILNEKKIKNQNLLEISEIANQIHSLLMGEMIKAYIWSDSKSLKYQNEKLWKSVERLMP